MLVRLHDFHGWTAGALWEDIKFDLKHFAHIERLALVGDRKWEAGMAVFCKPFTTATFTSKVQSLLETGPDVPRMEKLLASAIAYRQGVGSR